MQIDCTNKRFFCRKRCYKIKFSSPHNEYYLEKCPKQICIKHFAYCSPSQPDSKGLNSSGDVELSLVWHKQEL